MQRFLLKAPLFKFILGLCLVFCGSYVSALTEREALDFIQKKVGPLTNATELPELKRILNPISAKMGERLALKLVGTSVTSTELLIVKSQEVNAFVVVIKAPGKSKTKNLVVLTTAIIKSFLLDDVRFDMNEGLNDITGIMAHEFAHPIDKLDEKKGIENHYGKAGSHAIELRADFGAVGTLEDVQLPAKNLYNAIKRMSQWTSRRKGVVGAMGSTHPDDELRLGVQRWRLSASRLLRGQSSVEPLQIEEESCDRIAQELLDLVEPKFLIDYKVPQNLSEAADRIESLLVKNQKTLNESQSIEALAITLWVDQYIEDQKNVFASTEVKDRQRILEAWISNSPAQAGFFSPRSRIEEFDVPRGTAVEYLMNRHVRHHGLRDFRPHALRLEQIEFLSKARMQSFLRTQLRRRQAEYLAKSQDVGVFSRYTDLLKSQIHSFKKIASLEAIFEAWIAEPMDYNRRGQNLSTLLYEGDRYAEATTVLNALVTETHVHSFNFMRAAKLFYQIYLKALEREFQVWQKAKDLKSPHREESAKLSSEIRTFITWYKSGFLKSSHRSFERVVQAEMLFPKIFKTLQKFISELYQETWKQRSYYGFSELLGNGGGINWKFINRFAGESDSEDLIKAKVRRSVMSYLRSIDFSNEKLSPIPWFKRLTRGGNDHDFPLGTNYRTLPSWYASEVERALWPRTALELQQLPLAQRKGAEQLDHFLHQHVLNRILNKDPERLVDHFTKALLAAAVERQEKLPATQWTYADMERVNVEALSKAFALDVRNRYQLNLLYRCFDESRRWFYVSYVALIEKLDLNPKARGDILKKIFADIDYTVFIEAEEFSKIEMNPSLFMRQGHESHAWLFSTAEGKTKDLAQRVYREMQRAGLVKTLPDFFNLIFDSSEKIRNYSDQDYSEAMNSLRSEFDREIDEAIKKQNDTELFRTFQNYTKLLHNFKYRDMYRGERQDNITNTIYYVDTLLKILNKVTTWNSRQYYEAFILLTNHKATPETDLFFDSKILPLLKPAEYDLTIQRMLTQNRIYSEELRVRLAGEQTDFNIEKRKAKNKNGLLSSNDMFQIVERLEQMIPNDSSAKDKVLEKIGWNLSLTSHYLNDFVEETKSANWAKYDPKFAIVASALTNVLRDLSINDKLSLLDIFVVHKQNSRLPDWFTKRIFASVLRDVKLEFSDEKLHDRMARETAYHTIGYISKFLDSTTPMQRLPMLEMILGSREFELLKKENIFEAIVDRYLKLPLGSEDRIHLEAYLTVIEEHERPMTMAYLLAQSQDREQNKSGSLRAVLEAFPPVGIKLGQRGRTYDVFGPQYEAELRELKDKATPMSRAEIEGQINAALAPEEKGFKIDIKELRGSASIGVVVIATIDTGEGPPVEVALKVQRPFLERQISTNMELGRRYIAEVARRKGIAPSNLFLALVDAMEDQFASEIDFRQEAKNTVLAEGIVREISKGFSNNYLQGWTVAVPKVLSILKPKRTLVAFEALPGETLNAAFKNSSLSAEEKNIVGDIVARVSLQMFFRFGFFDPDRHLGNWMIDLKSKRLFMIDLGQMTAYEKSSNPFVWDSRLTLAEMLWAANVKSVDGLLRSLEKMTDTEKNPISESVRDKMRKSLEAWMARSEGLGLQESLRDLVQTIYDQGYKIRSEFTFGVLNGLMTLAGEGYVDQNQLKEILASEIKVLALKKMPLAIKKLPTVLASKAKSSVAGTRNSLSPLLPRKSQPGFESASMCRELFTF